jgi:hypothetical protein
MLMPFRKAICSGEISFDSSGLILLKIILVRSH